MIDQNRLYLAPYGALTLRQMPDNSIAETFIRALLRLREIAFRKRRTRITEGTMKPEHHNFIVNPAQGSTINAGQFGSIFAPHPCRGCDTKLQAYDAETPARPPHYIAKAVAALFVRKRT